MATTSPGHRIGLDMAACFPELDPERIQPRKTRRHRHEGAVEELREEHYNATITHFEPTHSDLWVLRVKPDHGGTDYTPGQYATLGLGYWEERVDDAIDPNLGDRWFKLIRRSYSISSRVLDDHGYLVDEGGLDELEFYIVLVPPTEDNIPELTPRLALKRPGDRIYLGPRWQAATRSTRSPIRPAPSCSSRPAPARAAQRDDHRTAAEGPSRTDRVGGFGS